MPPNPPPQFPDPDPRFTILGRQGQKPQQVTADPPLPPTITPLLDDEEGGTPYDQLTDHQAIRLRGILLEQARRKLESIRLYEPLPTQLSFHASQSRIRLLRGSNRSGKTLAACAEVAMAVTGQHRSRSYPKENGRTFCVGKDLAHVGQVMWRKLGRAGAYKIIRDAVTGIWRAYRPWDAGDAARRDEAKPAPPLIPPRFIKEIGWENKKENIPAVVRLHNGWELSFFSSLAKPPQGSDIDQCWMDEEIVDSEWFPEMSARLLDRGGSLIWSATPQAGTDQLFELHERAEKDRMEPKPSVEEFVVLLADNPHFRDEDKKTFAEDLNEEDYRVRVGGEFAVTSFKVYPQFHMSVHGVPWMAIPPNWTRFMVVDPGHQVCAALFAAVPPREDAVYLYDELYLKQCDAGKFGEAVAHKVGGQIFHAFLMDMHMALHTEMGIGRTVESQYAAALKERNIRSEVTGSRFQLASDDVQGGILAVHGWLRLRSDGKPKLRVLEGTCPNFEWEIKRYHKQRIKGQVTDRPHQRGNVHTMDCVRYLAIYDPKYSKPRKGKHAPTGAVKAFRDKQKRAQGGEGAMIHLGPGKGR
jgi:hypothetical protein